MSKSEELGLAWCSTGMNGSSGAYGAREVMDWLKEGRGAGRVWVRSFYFLQEEALSNPGQVLAFLLIGCWFLGKSFCNSVFYRNVTVVKHCPP